MKSKFKILVTYIVFSSVLFSCKNANKVISNDALEKKQSSKTEEMQSENYVILNQSSYGGLKQYENRVIKSEDELKEVYNDINSKRSPALDIPVINFSKETVVAIFIGEKNTGGYSIQIESVTDLDNQIKVIFKEATAKPGENVSMALTQPYCIIKIPYTNNKVTVKKVN